jgi:hypothetical protein
MSVPPSKVARSYVAPGTLWALIRNRDITTGAGKLTASDLGVVTDRPAVSLGWNLVAGWPVDHGTVADESAMLALHTFAGAAATTLEPRYVAPGDSCTRTDDPGWKWFCLSGNGTTLAQWERRPADGHTHSDLASAIAAKADPPANAAALDRISAVSGGPLLWDGDPVAGSSSTALWQDPSVQWWFGPEGDMLGADGVCTTTGDGVAAWPDVSRWCRTLTQSSSGARPTYVSNLGNGHPGIKSASGTSQRLEASLNTYASGVVGDFSVFCVASRGAATGITLYFGTAGSSRLALYWESGSLICSTGAVVASLTYTPTTDLVLIEVRWRGTTVTFCVNGTSIGTATATHTHGTAAWTLGVGGYYSTQGCDVSIGSIAVLDGGASTAFCDAVRAYFLAQWDL